MAANRGLGDMVRLLLDRGAAVDTKMSWGGETALFRAAFQGHADVVTLLAKRGADINTMVTLFFLDWVKKLQYRTLMGECTWSSECSGRLVLLAAVGRAEGFFGVWVLMVRSRLVWLVVWLVQQED